MIEQMPLTTIGLIIIIAIALSILVKKFGQNPVLGFIIAGFILGPALINFLHPNDPLVKGFGEVGLFILLFYLGLELSLKDFIEAGTTAIGLALIDMAALIGIGFLISFILGFSLFFSIIIGFMLFSTSTAIVAKFVLDNKMIELAPAKLAISILILQDFLGILLLVFATTLSKAGTALNLALTALMFATTTFFVVSVLSKRVEEWLTKNEFGHVEVTLYALGVGLIVATLAQMLDLSTALGAYFAGFALAETKAGRRIKADIQFLRDFFLVFFFVSFGTTLFFDYEVNKVIIPEITQLFSIIGIALLLGLGVIITNLIVFALFGEMFGLKKEDGSIAAILLTPLGEFVVIIATTVIAANNELIKANLKPLLSANEALILPSIAFLLIAITVILFQPLYSNINLHRKISSLIPSIKKKKIKKTIIKKHTSESMEELKKIALNLFTILAIAWIVVLLYYQLPRFGLPIIFSRQITTTIIFMFFAAIPLFRIIRSLIKLHKIRS